MPSFDLHLRGPELFPAPRVEFNHSGQDRHPDHGRDPSWMRAAALDKTPREVWLAALEASYVYPKS